METETPQSAPTPPRIPPAVDGIQVNFCKNPACGNFGVPASDAAKWSRGDRYKRSGDKESRSLVCQGCGESIPIKSNKGIAEELQRMMAFLAPLESVCCKNDECPNNRNRITIAQDSSLYISFGPTEAGSQRFRCKTCLKTFSIPLAANLRQRKKGKSTEVFRLLTCQVAIRKMAKNARLGKETVHRYIHLIHRQCLLFAANRERSLPERKFKRLYVAVDRQQHEVNWISQKDRRTTPLQAAVSADQKTGYIFALHVNFDPDLDHAEVDETARAIGDNLLDPPFRQFARLWVNEDYERSSMGMVRSKPRKRPIAEQIETTYEEVCEREDVEASDTPEPGTRLPSKGMQVHAEYTLYGHFFYLSKILAGAEKIRFYCDQESGIRAAIMAAFHRRITAKECDAFYVKINKELTTPQKLSLVAKSQRELEEFRASSKAYEEVRDQDLRVFKATAEMATLRAMGKWRDRWFIFPFPNMSEPEKGVCYLTNTKMAGFDYEDEHLARLHLKGSLHAVDRFFNLVRSNLSLLQRPVLSASSGRRTWYRTNPYDPHHVAVTLDLSCLVQLHRGRFGRQDSRYAARLGGEGLHRGRDPALLAVAVGTDEEAWPRLQRCGGQPPKYRPDPRVLYLLFGARKLLNVGFAIFLGTYRWSLKVRLLAQPPKIKTKTPPSAGSTGGVFVFSQQQFNETPCTVTVAPLLL